MALITVVLNIPPALTQAVTRIAQAEEKQAAAAERQADAAEAILAELTKPDHDQQSALDALVGRLAQSNTTLAAEVEKILAAHTP